MDYLQYKIKLIHKECLLIVLNLIINGLPSILNRSELMERLANVLNLIINGLPSILF